MKSNKDLISKEIEQAEKEMLSERYKTALKKAQFVSEMKNGLGAEIKANPNRPRVIRQTWFKRFTSWVKRIFTTF